MGQAETKFDWRIVYGIFCLIYTACLVYLGHGNFDKVYGEYRQAVFQLQPAQIKRITLEELAQDCRAKLKRRSRRTNELSAPGIETDSCQNFPPTILKEHLTTVTKRLQVEKKRFQRKLIVFYLSFGLFFVALPLYVLYQLLKLLIWIFRDIKISR